jgi:septal ring factor EnvC (AmiA/AmiB activator)
MFAQIKLYALIAFITVTLSALGLGYWIVNGIIAENKVLQRNVATLESAKATQDTAIAALEGANKQQVERVNQMQAGLTALQGSYDQSQRDVAELRKRYSRITVQRGKDGNVLPTSNDALNSGVNDINGMLRRAVEGQRGSRQNRTGR